jgi:tetratricopeptide (TPR) repeat protein
MKPQKSRRWLAALVCLGLVLPLLYFALRGSDGTSRIESASVTLPTLDSITRPGSDTRDSEHELRMLEQELSRKPDHLPVLLRMAQLARELGRNDQALTYLRRAVDQDPAHADARLELGRVLWESGDVEGALLETRRLLDEDADNVDALYNLGAIYGNLHQTDQARLYWERAASTEPNSESGRLAALALTRLTPQ